MDYKQFKNAIETICENESAWADWQSISDIEEWLGVKFNEQQECIVLNAMESNGKTLKVDMRELESEVWGFNFGGVR